MNTLSLEDEIIHFCYNRVHRPEENRAEKQSSLRFSCKKYLGLVTSVSKLNVAGSSAFILNLTLNLKVLLGAFMARMNFFLITYKKQNTLECSFST